MSTARDRNHAWREADSVCSLSHRERGGVRGSGLSIDPNPLSPMGRGNPPSLPRVWGSEAERRESRRLAIASLIPSPPALRFLGPILSHSWPLRLRHGRPRAYL